MYNTTMQKVSNNVNTSSVSFKQNNNNNCTDKADIKDNKEVNLNHSTNACYNKIAVNKVDKVSDNQKVLQEKFKNCLIMGAIGDAFGLPVERIRTPDLWEHYGKDGIQDLRTIYGVARVSDDTQMSMFTADGLIKSSLKNKGNAKKCEPDYNIIYNSYKDWYDTQTKEANEKNHNGWLSEIDDLYSPVGPGRTCLASLKSGQMGTLEHPLNNSNGCGGVMRVAPVGLFYNEDPKLAFRVGAKCAVMTHGGTEAYLPAGTYAALIANLAQGKDLQTSVKESLDILKTYKGHEKTYDLISKATYLAGTDMKPYDAITSLGYGFDGDEALAISIYCALKSPDDAKSALIMAVNHSGDSDSTGSITGQILGTYKTTSNLPKEWLDTIEFKKELSELSDDLFNPNKISNANIKYPINKKVVESNKV